MAKVTVGTRTRPYDPVIDIAEEEEQTLPAPPLPTPEPENNPEQKPGPQRQPNPLPDLEKTRDPGKNYIYRKADRPNNPKSVAIKRPIDWQSGLSFSSRDPLVPSVKYFVPTLIAAGFIVRYDEGMPILGLFDNMPIKGHEGQNFGKHHVSVYLPNQSDWDAWYEADKKTAGTSNASLQTLYLFNLREIK